MNFRLSAKPNAGAAALRSKHDFNALVVFFRKHFVGIRSIFQSHPVADDGGRINLALLNQFQ
jgi:hypothetical protein